MLVWKPPRLISQQEIFPLNMGLLWLGEGALREGEEWWGQRPFPWPVVGKGPPGRAACSLCAAMEDRPSVSQSDWIQPFSYLPQKTHPICSLKQSNFHYFLSLSIKKKANRALGLWEATEKNLMMNWQCVYTCTLYTDLANSWIMYF